MALREVIPGVSAVSLGISRGFMRETFPAFGDSLFWQGLPGSGWWENDDYDYSLNQRKAQLIGSISKTANYATPTSTAYYKMSYYDSEPLAAGIANEISVIAIARAGGTDGTIFSSEKNDDTAGAQMYISAGGTLACMNHAPTSTPVNIAASSDTGSTWEFVAMTIKIAGMVAYRRSPNTGMASASAVPTAIVAANVIPLVGRRTPNTQRTGGVQIAGIGQYTKALSAAEIDQAYAILKDLYAEVGIAI